jgi:hypothetical protein
VRHDLSNRTVSSPKAFNLLSLLSNLGIPFEKHGITLPQRHLMQSVASDRELIVRHRRREAARRPVTILPILKFLPCLLQVFQELVAVFP